VLYYSEIETSSH